MCIEEKATCSVKVRLKVSESLKKSVLRYLSKGRLDSKISDITIIIGTSHDDFCKSNLEECIVVGSQLYT